MALPAIKVDFALHTLETGSACKSMMLLMQYAEWESFLFLQCIIIKTSSCNAMPYK